MTDPKEAMQFAQDEVKEHLAICCLELLEWDNTAILCNGHIRRIALKMTPAIRGSLTLQIVAGLVRDHALRFVAERSGM